LLLGAGAVVLLLRKSGHHGWSDFERLLVVLVPAVVLYLLAVGAAGRQRGESTLSSQSVLLVTAILLTPLALYELLAWAGANTQHLPASLPVVSLLAGYGAWRVRAPYAALSRDSRCCLPGCLSGGRFSTTLLKAGRSPKTVRNVLTFLHSVFEHAIDNGWCSENPVRRASRPRRQRAGDAEPDVQFLTIDELEAVVRAIPDETIVRTPAPTRRGRSGPAPPPSCGCPRPGHARADRDRGDDRSASV
jgi:hypothetical protein